MFLKLLLLILLFYLMFFNSSIDRTELILFILTAILAAFNFNNPKIDITQPTGGGAAEFPFKIYGGLLQKMGY